MSTINARKKEKQNKERQRGNGKKNVKKRGKLIKIKNERKRNKDNKENVIKIK